MSADELQLWECVRMHVGEALWADVAALTPKEGEDASLLKKSEIEKARAAMEGTHRREHSSSHVMVFYMESKLHMSHASLPPHALVSA